MIELTDKQDRSFRVDPDRVTDVRAYADTAVSFALTRITVENRAIFLARGSAPELLDRINAARSADPLDLGPFIVTGPPARARRFARDPMITTRPNEDYL